ncbi:MAG: MFS transporter [Anaerolineae bacterium]
MFDFIKLPETHVLRTLSHDGRLLFATRMVRMFAYGTVAVVLALYLAQLALSDGQIGGFITWTLIGDAVISLTITLIADRVGRKQMLLLGTGLMVFAGAALALSDNLLILTLAAIVGTLSPSGNEVGPFLSIEQAILPQTSSNEQRTAVFAWYNLFGSFSTAIGALFAGGLASVLQTAGRSPLESYRIIMALYAVLGLLLAVMFTRLSAAAEAQKTETLGSRFGLHRSQGIVLRLSALFALDSFAGGLVLQSVLVYWFRVRFGAEDAVIGSIFFGANLLAGLSALAAGRIAARFGLINTMVWTHIPSNILLMLVPLMPSLSLAILVLLLRFSISQMDVPTRQSYIMAVVAPDERSAAAGVTSIVRTASSSMAPAITGFLLQSSLLGVPFFLAGGLKIVYDLALYRSFRAIKPPEEKK